MPNTAQFHWQFTTISTLFVGYAGYYICRSNLSVALPLIHDEFGLDKTDTGIIASVGILMYAFGKISNGLLGDFLGGRVMFLMGMMVSVLCTIGFGFAGGLTVWILIWTANRYFQSMGWVGLVKISARWFPVRRHATVMAILSMSYLVGDAFTRWYLGTILEWGYSWQAMFFISAATLLGISIVALFTLRSSPGDVELDEPLASQGNVYGDTQEAIKPKNLRELLRPLLRSKIFWLIASMSFGLTLIRETFNFWNPTFLHEAVGMSVADAARQSWVFPMAGALSCLLSGLTCDLLKGRFGRVILPSTVILVVMLTILATTDLTERPTLALTLLALVAFFLMAPYTLLAGVMALDIGGKSGTSTTAGLIDSAGYFGAVISGVGIGTIAQQYDWSVAFGTLAVLAGGSSVAALFYLIHHERAMGPEGQ